MKRLGPENRQLLLDDWSIWARPSQLPPEGDWRFWLIMGGRGSGKTRAGAEWVRRHAEAGTRGRFALVGQTFHDVREVMIGGESGLIAIAGKDMRPVYEISRHRLMWPNGAQAMAFSAEDPDSLRGPQFDAAWCDEFAAWQYGAKVLSTLDMALRLGADPRAAITTTPKPSKAMRDLLQAPGVTLTRAATYENEANLAPGFLASVNARYAGTFLARQELEGELLEEIPGALFNRSLIEAARLPAHAAPALRRIVVAVDPVVGGGKTENREGDECGIIVAGQDAQDVERFYVMADLSLRPSGPEEWARIAMQAFERFGAHRVVAEKNQGGEMVRTILGMHGMKGAVELVSATQSKRGRAEPAVLQYQRGKVSHIGAFPALEDQMCAFGARESGGGNSGDDRVDALVWALWALMRPQGEPGVRSL